MVAAFNEQGGFFQGVQCAVFYLLGIPGGTVGFYGRVYDLVEGLAFCGI